MDTMLARYLDGELTEHEALAFEAMLEANPTVAAELRSLESSLDLFVNARCGGTARAFPARVMEALPPPVRTESPGFGRRAWSLAATIVLCIGLGWAAGRYAPVPRSPGPITDSAATAAAGGETADTSLRWVRLVYVPDDTGVSQVAVAGDFNGWNAKTTPMHRQGRAWVAWLALPADVYEYMFVENGGERWLTDPLAVQTRADGFGGENAVLDLSL